MKQLLIIFVRAYQAVLSPLLGGACRFHPSCSQYAVEAIERHGAGRGGWLALKRLLRCRPFAAGGLDPVPEEAVSHGGHSSSFACGDFRTSKQSPHAAIGERAQ